MSTDQAMRPVEFAPPPEQQESTWAFLLFAWRRKWLVIFASAIGLGLGYLHFLRQTPVYQSSAQILLVKKKAETPIEGLNVDTGYDSIHQSLLRSPAVANLAVEKYGLASLPTLSGSPSPAAVVMGGLSVSGGGTDRNTGEILQLTYSSVSREDCPKVLEAVVDAYEEFLGETYQNVSQKAIELFVEAKDQLDTQLTHTEAEYRKFRYEAPLLFAGDSSQNVHEARLQQIEQVRSAAVLENSKLQAKIDAVEAALKRGGSREALNLMVGHVEQMGNSGGNSGGSSIEEQLFPLLLEEEMLRDQYGVEHPKLQVLRKRIELTRNHLMGTDALAKDVKEESRDFFDVFLESLHEQIKMNEQTITEMGRLFDKEREAAKSLATFQIADETFRSEIQRKDRLFNAIIDRLEEINLVSDTGGARIQMIHPPGLGGQIQPDMQKILVTAGLLGFVAGLGLAFVVDSADRRFRSPDEIRNNLGLPVIGHIPTIPVTRAPKKKENGEPAPLAPVLLAFHQPRGRIAEAYRAVRTAIYFSTRGGGNQVIQITSPNPSDGKTTLAANLAISVANSGKKVLLVDTDFRRPRCHRLFNLDNSAGIGSVIAGTAELADTIHATQIDNLFVLPCGPRPANPSELVTSRRFEELLAVLREKYDLVILDTPPVLAVTDPLNVAPRVDGVLLVLRLTKSARAAGRRTIDALESLGANVLGIVVNGVGGSPGYGGYYGKHGKYGYGYRYGGYGGGRYSYDGDYRYGYGDSQSDDKTYYSEDDPESASDKQPAVAHDKANGKP